MHDVSLSRAARARRALAFAGLAAMGAGLLMLAAAPRSAAATQARAHAALASGNCSVTAAGATTCTGPNMWDPAAQEAVRQREHGDGRPGFQLLSTSWCRCPGPTSPRASPTTHPGPTTATPLPTTRRWSPSAGAPTRPAGRLLRADNHGLPLAFGPSGIPNTQYAITTAKGTGQASIDVETSLENSFLGCDQNHPCSLVVVPGAGRRAGPLHRSQRRHRLVRERERARRPTPSPSPPAPAERAPGPDRIVIPLSFAPDAERLPAAQPGVHRRRVPDDGRCHAAMADRPVRGSATA